MSTVVESDDGAYRWWLEDGGPNKLGFCMLNPSTADAIRPDPTKTKTMGFARELMYDGVCIANAYPRRSTDPAELFAQGVDEATRWERNQHYLAALASLPLVIVGWGNHCPRDHAERVLEVLRRPGRPLYCFAINQNGNPKHPLYIPYSARLLEYPLNPLVNNK